MPVPTFPAIPDAPNRSTDTQSEFDDKAEAFTAYLADDFGDDMDEYAEGLVDAAAAAGYSSVSTTSVAIGTGSKSFTIETGKMIVGGQYMVIADAAAPTTNLMWGQVTSYNSSTGALVFESLAATGSGTKTSWFIGLSGPQGATGGSQLTSPAFTGTPFEDVYTITDGAGFLIDAANGSVQTITLTASRTPTISIGAGQFVLLLVDDGSAYTLTWTSISPTWFTDSGAAPTLKTSGYTPIIFFKVGSTVYGARVGNG